MNKKISIILVFLATGLIAFGVMISQFRSWNDSVQNSPDIVIAKCTWTFGSKPSRRIMFNGSFPSDVEVLSVIRGNAGRGPSHLLSGYWPYPDQQFVIFGRYRNDGNFTGYDAAQIIPLSRDFPFGSLNGKTFDEQIQIIFSNRLSDLSEEISRDTQDAASIQQYLKGH